MKSPRITIAPLQGHGCNQIVEFVSVTGEMTFIQGELVDQSKLPTNDYIEVHNELNDEGEVVHVIYVNY